ncbi:hypothetical protein STCU_00504 [Strigomonas culicis]|uniref:GRAM domain-containing protein n=1 Tax=Strigomonas culicis TaxID=28005 RepID=S9V0K6_9TRYP|nr:hypothetical protein STCU_00504 [Strigomonas culicis]|eukprot:EPY36592.1 hypothetical protein STCU_00504 [Strigomonas culicis]
MSTQPEIINIPQEPASDSNNTSHPAAHTYITLAPLVYSGPVPKPSEACADPLPEEQLRLNHEQKQRELAEKEREAKTASNAPAPTSTDSAADNIAHKASGWFASIKSAATLIAVNVEKTTHDMSIVTEDKVRQLDNQRNFDRFRTHFRSLVRQGEVLLADYGCSTIHGGRIVDGHLQITRHYVCFSAQTSNVVEQAADRLRMAVNENTGGKISAPPAKVEGIRDAIPLASVACVQRCVSLPKVDHPLPYFLPLPDPSVAATALQIYVPEGNRVFQFFNFESITSKAGGILSENLKGTALDRAYCYLDHAWRDCVAVPLEGVEYAS